MSTQATPASDVRDVIIVGSGPAGYTAAIYTARADLKPLMIAGSVTAGGELMNTTEVENFPGFPDGIMGPDLMENLGTQAEKFGTEIMYDDVTSVELEGEIKTVTLADGQEFKARTVILSTGSAYRELGVEGEKRLVGHGVSSCATCDGFFFKGHNGYRVGKLRQEDCFFHCGVATTDNGNVVALEEESVATHCARPRSWPIAP